MIPILSLYKNIWGLGYSWELVDSTSLELGACGHPKERVIGSSGAVGAGEGPCHEACSFHSCKAEELGHIIMCKCRKSSAEKPCMVWEEKAEWGPPQ